MLAGTTDAETCRRLAMMESIKSAHKKATPYKDIKVGAFIQHHGQLLFYSVQDGNTDFQSQCNAKKIIFLSTYTHSDIQAQRHARVRSISTQSAASMTAVWRG